jgi:hypothetical protein
MSVIRVSRCGITRGTLSGKHVLTLIWKIMTGGSFKIISNWAVLTGYLIAKMTANFTEEDLRNSKFIQEHKRH